MQLSPDTSFDDALRILDVPSEVHENVRQALRTLVSAGMLTDAADPTPPIPSDVPLRDPAEEVARLVAAHPDIEKLDPAFVALYRGLTHSTLTSVPLAYALYQAVRHIIRADLPGALVECGVWRGGSMALAAAMLAEFGDRRRELWLYDTFDWRWDQLADCDGFTLLGCLKQGGVEEVGQDDHLRMGTSVEEVGRLLASTGYPRDLIRLVPGYVQDTIPGQAASRIALLRLDTDLYESTLHELTHLYPRLVPGGILIVDDYGKLDGATHAVDEYFGGIDDPPLLIRVDIQGRIAVKSGSTGRAGDDIE